MQRRTFLQTTGAGLAAILARPLWGFASDDPYLKTIGLQLYTLRNQLSENVRDTLKAVADAGYYQVETGGVVGSEEIFAGAREVGLQITSAMIDSQTLVHPDREGVPSFDATLDAAVEHKLKFLVIPYVGKESRQTADQLKTLAQRSESRWRSMPQGEHSTLLSSSFIRVRKASQRPDWLGRVHQGIRSRTGKVRDRCLLGHHWWTRSGQDHSQPQGPRGSVAPERYAERNPHNLR